MVAVTVEAAVGAATTAVLMAVAALAAVEVTRAVNLWMWTAARERVRRMTRHLWLQRPLHLRSPWI